jgi:hypothetical protein
MIYASDESEGQTRVPSPLRDAIWRRATRLAIMVGAGLFVMMLTVSLATRVPRFGLANFEALRENLFGDLIFNILFTSVGALIGAAVGAILAVVSSPRENKQEPEKHPLD